MKVDIFGLYFQDVKMGLLKGNISNIGKEKRLINVRKIQKGV